MKFLAEVFAITIQWFGLGEILAAGLDSFITKINAWIEPLEGLRENFNVVREVSREYRLDCIPQIYDELQTCESCSGLSLLAVNCNPVRLCFGCWCDATQEHLERAA